MMKPSLLLSLCLLITTAFYLCPSSSSPAEPSVLHDMGRQAMMTRDLDMPFVNRKLKSHNIKVVDDKSKKSNVRQGGFELQTWINNDNTDDLVYHTDYHGVTTHPTPTPKHP
ncbi:hypothetical protein BT93_C0048 [Corymbia citriodora subsp. variegata]|nr:hypothetical protein BT93_C0048 [Corymbia citriodora subsp. variegata]